MKNLTPEEWRDNYDEMENMSFMKRKPRNLLFIVMLTFCSLIGILLLIFR